MLKFDVGAVAKSVGALRAIETFIDAKKDEVEFQKKTLSDGDAKTVKRMLSNASVSIEGLHLRITEASIIEFQSKLDNKIKYSKVASEVQDIGVILRRELGTLYTFCVDFKSEKYLDFEFSSINIEFETDFPAAVFEIDEAGKCYALGRPTACVFHLMRAMEIGVRAVSKCLGIPDPVKGNDKNWGAILTKIKQEITTRNSSSTWKNNDKQLFESLYASLDATRVAWRNTTMHIENKYTDDEAEHIFIAVRGFMKVLSGRMDEDGLPLA